MPHVKGNKFKPRLPPEENGADVEIDRANLSKNGITGGVDEPGKRPPKSALPRPAVPTVVLPAPKGKGTPAGAATSNWEALKALMQKNTKPGQSGSKRKRPVGGSAEEEAGPAAIKRGSSSGAQLTRILALDCEMVGVGPNGSRSCLARVSIVNSAGAVVYDTFVAPTEKVTDFRTKWSGVRASDLKGALSAEEVRAAVENLIRGRLLVGHALENDLEALGVRHPHAAIRDTSRYPPLMRTLLGGRNKPQKLRHLAQQHLGTDIQSGEHDPVEDARAALALYQKHRDGWERWVAKGGDTHARGKTGSQKTGAGVGATHEGVAQLDMARRSKGPLGAERLAELATRDYMADL